MLSGFCEQSLSGFVGEGTAPVEERLREREKVVIRVVGFSIS